MDPSDSEVDRNINKISGNYKIEQFLGKGAFGRVYRCKDIETHKVYAAKIIPRCYMTTKKAATALERELNALDEINDSHVIKLIDCFRTKSNYYVIMDYCNGGDLSSYLEANQSYLHKRVGECVARQIIRQICQGMKGIFDKGFVHRDVKLANILLHFKNSRKQTLTEATVKIGDLGFARTVTPSEWAKSRVGTPLTMAPEVILKGKKYNYQVDVWAIGVITFQLLVGFLPFMAEDYQNFLQVVADGEFRIPQSLNLSKHSLHFINKCLQHDPEKRMYFSDLLEHSWFTLSDEEIQSSVKELNHKTDQNWFKKSRIPPPCQEELKEENQILLNAKDMKELDEKYRAELNNGIDHLSSLQQIGEEDEDVPENVCNTAPFDSDEDDESSIAPLSSTLMIPKKKIPY